MASSLGKQLCLVVGTPGGFTRWGDAEGRMFNTARLYKQCGYYVTIPWCQVTVLSQNS